MSVGAINTEGELRNFIEGVLGDSLLPSRNLAARLLAGTGTPEGSVAAPVGTVFQRVDGGAGTTLYVKESGTGNTGWVGK
jgi:hypothetical protein